ncbi:hypothetical protein RBE51_20780 [Pseudomonas taiwanensis]|uniref:hypothetical protein n=1 Tax=Pseudomonas taiwanensis TaxID=470150 RepID=UPI0028DD4A03|nr:hypothetical protein [Pseudomonas taiwanensis]MDT8925232.1 hypothetical protein [Pseudomonas taiwanensis]
MSKILSAQAAFTKSLSDYAKEERTRNQLHRRSDFGRAESRAYGALVTLAGLAGTVGYAVYSQHLYGADVSSMANALFTGPVVAGTIAYIAHQAAPFRQDIVEKLTHMASGIPNIGAGFGRAISGLGASLRNLGDTLGLSSEARALKGEAQFIKSVLGVQNMGQVERIAKATYGKDNANPVIHDAQWLRLGIDTAVKDKLAAGDTSTLSYSDIEAGVLKCMDKAKVLAKSPQEMLGHTNIIENVLLMVGSANPSNLGLKSGDFSKIKDHPVLKTLKSRDADKGGSEPSLC